MRGGVRLISSARMMLAKTGPGTKRKVRLTGRLVFFHHLGPGDIGGHEIGGELNAAKVEMGRLGDRPDHERLGEARHADQQRMAAGDERNQNFVEHGVLTDNPRRHLTPKRDRRLKQTVALGG